MGKIYENNYKFIICAVNNMPFGAPLFAISGQQCYFNAVQLTGEAVDFVPQSKVHKLEDVVVWIDDNLTFRQCILEKNTKNRWIHLALGTGNQVFRKNHTTGKSSLFYSDPYLKTVIYSK